MHCDVIVHVFFVHSIFPSLRLHNLLSRCATHLLIKFIVKRSKQSNIISSQQWHTFIVQHLHTYLLNLASIISFDLELEIQCKLWTVEIGSCDVLFACFFCSSIILCCCLYWVTMIFPCSDNVGMEISIHQTPTMYQLVPLFLYSFWGVVGVVCAQELIIKQWYWSGLNAHDQVPTDIMRILNEKPNDTN